MTSHANARLRQGQLQLIGTAVILLIAITATIVSLRLVRRRIHAPLANLIATTYRFSTGDFASPVPTLRGEDEFSTMAQTLEGLRLTALEEQRMRNRLEHLVEERTRSLQEHEAKVRRLVDANIIGIFMWESGGSRVRSRGLEKDNARQMARGRRTGAGRAWCRRNPRTLREGILPQRRQLRAGHGRRCIF
jgi:HAMP domain-containing protein